MAPRAKSGNNRPIAEVISKKWRPIFFVPKIIFPNIEVISKSTAISYRIWSRSFVITADNRNYTNLWSQNTKNRFPNVWKTVFCVIIFAIKTHHFAIFQQLKNNHNYGNFSNDSPMDSQIKKQFDSLCQQFGMSSNTAINIFINQAVRSRSIGITHLLSCHCLFYIA